MSKFYKNFPNYDDDSDYNTNANSYYKDLGRKTKLIKLLAKRIWEYENTLNETLEQIEQRLTDYILENDTLMTERLENWDKRIDEMPEEMRTLFIEWLNDGTLEQIINDDVLGNKADKTFVDSEIERLDQEDENITTQLAHYMSEPKENVETTMTENEKPILGPDLMSSATVKSGLGDGWTDTGTNYAHTTGSTTSLVFEFSNLPVDNYILTVYIQRTNPEDRNGISDYSVKLGGSEPFETYRGTPSSQQWGILHGGESNELVITPDVDFDGQLAFDLKQVIEPSKASLKLLGMDKLVAHEIRPTTNDSKSLYVGLNAGQFSTQADGEENVGVGNNVLGSNMTGFWNTGVGSRALENITNGSRNVGVGYLALSNLISGDRNVAIGTFSQRRNKYGRNNISLGADSLWYLERGQSNIAIGLLALGNRIDAEHNVAIGENALGAGDEGNHNIALGHNAQARGFANENISLGRESLRRNRLGQRNIAIGMYAQQDNDTGNTNIAFGYQALMENSTSSSNVAIGTLALQKHLDGHESVAIGNNALNKHINGRGNVGIGAATGRDLTDGQDNIFIGNNAGRTIENGSRNIIIGFNETGLRLGSDHLNIGGVITSQDMTTGIVELQKLKLTDLPTTLPSEPRMIWNDNGTLKIT